MEKKRGPDFLDEASGREEKGDAVTAIRLKVNTRAIKQKMNRSQGGNESLLLR